MSLVTTRYTTVPDLKFSATDFQPDWLGGWIRTRDKRVLSPLTWAQAPRQKDRQADRWTDCVNIVQF